MQDQRRGVGWWRLVVEVVNKMSEEREREKEELACNTSRQRISYNHSMHPSFNVASSRGATRMKIFVVEVVMVKLQYLQCLVLPLVHPCCYSAGKMLQLWPVHLPLQQLSQDTSLPLLQ